jgi:uncharacterized RDD family membrane protein YckC
MAEVVTGEAVTLELPVANFPSRIAALLIDMAIQIFVVVILFVVLVATRPANADYLAAELSAAYVIVIIAYPTTIETLSRGRTVGMLALGLRVVGDDGSPERFRQALVRALVGLFEIWSFLLAPVGLITSLFSERGKRVGDVFAGTYVIQERMPVRRGLPLPFTVVPPPLAEWARSLQVASLSDQTADAAGSYLRRFGELSPQARESLGIMLANAVAQQVSPLPPPGTPPAAYLSAVLAVRREHEMARFAAGFPAAQPTPAQLTPAQLPPAQPRSAPDTSEATASTDPAPAGATPSDTRARPEAASADYTDFVPPG